MNIYRFEVKDKLYFLNDRTDYFFKTIKEALSGEHVMGNLIGNIAYLGFNKLGIISNKKLLEKYSDGKVEEKKKDTGAFWRFETLPYQPLNWTPQSVNAYNGIVGSGGVGYAVPAEGQILGYGMATEVNENPRPIVTANSTWQEVYGGGISLTQTLEDQRVADDRERNAQQLRSYRDAFNRREI